MTGRAGRDARPSPVRRAGRERPARGTGAWPQMLTLPTSRRDPPPMKPLIIAIDGPSGAGKGTVARAVAVALDYRHVDSGAMYRAVGWKASRDGVALDQEAAVARVARESVIEVSATAVTIDGL